jgi:hypothetical protein
MSGPSSTRIDVTLYGFPPGRPVSAKLEQERSWMTEAFGWPSTPATDYVLTIACQHQAL